MKKAPEKVFEVGQKVQLDTQPFEWTIIVVNCDGLPNVAKIEREGKDELFSKFSRKVDIHRLKDLA